MAIAVRHAGWPGIAIVCPWGFICSRFFLAVCHAMVTSLHAWNTAHSINHFCILFCMQYWSCVLLAFLNVLDLGIRQHACRLKIIGKGTSSTVTHTTYTPRDMCPNLGPPNWVSKYVPFFWHMQLLAGVIWPRFNVRIHVPKGYLCSSHWLWCSWQLVWRRLVHLHVPSHHTIRDTCTRLLPLLEMFCKWELQEDCSDLRATDSEAVMESHELGRSLLFMVGHEDVGFDSLPHLSPVEPRINQCWTVIAGWPGYQEGYG